MQDNKVIRIDLQNKSLTEQISVLNAILQARTVLEDRGLKLYIRKKQLPTPSR